MFTGNISLEGFRGYQEWCYLIEQDYHRYHHHNRVRWLSGKYWSGRKKFAEVLHAGRLLISTRNNRPANVGEGRPSVHRLHQAPEVGKMRDR